MSRGKCDSEPAGLRTADRPKIARAVCPCGLAPPQQNVFSRCGSRVGFSTGKPRPLQCCFEPPVSPTAPNRRSIP